MFKVNAEKRLTVRLTSNQIFTIMQDLTADVSNDILLQTYKFHFHIATLALHYQYFHI